MNTPDDLANYIAAHGLAAVLITGIGETPTVPAAAAALGVSTDQIIKTLLFLVEAPGADGATRRPFVVISHGQKRVDKGLLATHWGVGKKRVTLAPADVVLDLLGYPAGGVPPFGHHSALPVLVDASILSLRTHDAGTIYGGGGDDRTMLRLTPAELQAVTGATWIDLTADPALAPAAP